MAAPFANYDTSSTGIVSNLGLFILQTTLSTVDDLRDRTSLIINTAIDYMMDGADHMDELESCEKNIMGVKLEKLWLKELGLPSKKPPAFIKRMKVEDPTREFLCPKLDTIIAGIDVDIKTTMNKNWMIAPECWNEWLILFKTNLVENHYSMGLFLANEHHLTTSKNQDNKKSVTSEGKETITWLIEKHPIRRTPKK